MAKAEWGTKRTCPGCGARFYDLRRDPILCPVCSAVYDPERQPRVRRGGGALRDEPVLIADTADEDRPARALDDELMEDSSDDAEIDDLEDAEGGGDGGDLDDLSAEDRELMEDASELGEDNDDIGEVMEHVDDEMGDKP